MTLDDLYYLFHAIRRYYMWYKSDNNLIYNHILAGAIEGLSKLIATYAAIEQTAVIHTLSLYKNVLDLESPDLFKDPSDDAINIDSVFKNIKSIYDRKLLKITYNTMLILEDEKVTEAEKKIYLEEIIEIPVEVTVVGLVHAKSEVSSKVILSPSFKLLRLKVVPVPTSP